VQGGLGELALILTLNLQRGYCKSLKCVAFRQIFAPENQKIVGSMEEIPKYIKFLLNIKNIPSLD
jgi:hypothetical protein